MPPTSKYVNLGFNRGVRLKHPGRLLKGTGKLVRHITIKRLEDLDAPSIKDFIEAAIADVPVKEGDEAASTRTGRTIIKPSSGPKRRPPRSGRRPLS